MDVRLLLLINCLIVVNCTSPISNRNDTTDGYELFEDHTKSEMGSIRQQLMNLQQAVVRIEMHAKQGLKLKIEEICQVKLQQQNCGENQAVQEIKLKTEDIFQIVLKQQNGNETQSTEEMKRKTNEIRQLVIRHHSSIARAIQEMKLKMEEIRQTVIQQQNRPRKECPLGFDYLPEADSCYTIIFEEMTWDNATARCQEILPYVHLAEITSQSESNAVARYLQTLFNRTSIRTSGTAGWCDGGYLLWISGQRKNARCYNPFVWKTLNGFEVPFSYTNWGRGEPNCAGEEACVSVASCKAHAWNDYRCDKLAFPLCEI